MRPGDWSRGSAALATFLSWFGDVWQKGALLLLENWGWVCIRARWAEFRLSTYKCRIYFPPYAFILIKSSSIEEASNWQLCLLPLHCCLCSVVQAPTVCCNWSPGRVLIGLLICSVVLPSLMSKIKILWIKSKLIFFEVFVKGQNLMNKVEISFIPLKGTQRVDWMNKVTTAEIRSNGFKVHSQ